MCSKLFIAEPLTTMQALHELKFCSWASASYESNVDNFCSSVCQKAFIVKALMKTARIWTQRLQHLSHINDLTFHTVECFKGSTPIWYNESHPHFYFCITHPHQTYPRGSSLCIEGNPLVTTFLSTLWQALKATVQLPVHILEHRVELSSTKAKAADLSSLTFPISSLDISLHLACRS